MHRLVPLCAGVIALEACSSRPVEVRPLSASYSAAELAIDVARFKSSLVEGHAALTKYRSARDVDSIFRALEDSVRVPRTALAFWQLASDATAALRDDHTSVLPNQAVLNALYRDPGRTLPLRFAIVDGRIYILRNYLGSTGPADGAEVLTINGVAAADFIAQCARIVPTDGDGATRAVRKIERDFELTCALAHGLPSAYRLRLRGSAGDSSAIVVPAVSWRERRSLIVRYAPQDTLVPAAARLHFVDDSSIAVLTLANAFTKSNDFDPESFFEQSFDRIHRTGSRALVLDLRGNTGGTDRYAGALYARIASDTFTYYSQRYLNKRRYQFLKGTDDWMLNYASVLRFWWLRKAPDGRYALRLALDKPMRPDRRAFTGPVFVLIDGNSVSTSSEFASVFKARRRGIVLGEESGSALVGGTGATVSVVLPVSRLTLNLPIMTAYIAPAAGSADPPTRGVLPDIAISPSLRDRLSGADPVMTRALTLARDAARTPSSP